MSKTAALAAVCVFAGLLIVSATGCNTVYGFHPGLLGYPIPVTPYLQDRMEDKAHEAERYEAVPILGPIVSGASHIGIDAPSDDQIMRALEKVRPLEGGIPLLHTTQRNDVQIIKEKIADYVDEPRMIPMVGPCQVHHVHYKCIIYFSENTFVGWPVPYKKENKDAQEVIYIDHCHFHQVGNIDGGAGSNYQPAVQ